MAASFITTAKNQLTLPKAVVNAVGAAEYFDVEVRQGQIVLTPVRIQRGDAVRAKLAELGLGDADIVRAVRWARSGAAGHGVAEPPAEYATPAGRLAVRALRAARKRSHRARAGARAGVSEVQARGR